MAYDRHNGTRDEMQEGVCSLPDKMDLQSKIAPKDEGALARLEWLPRASRQECGHDRCRCSDAFFCQPHLGPKRWRPYLDNNLESASIAMLMQPRGDDANRFHANFFCLHDSGNAIVNE